MNNVFNSKWLQDPIKGVLLDISGVLKDGNNVIPGSLLAMEKLMASNLPYRLLTNETQLTRAQIVKKLNGLGYKVAEKDIFAPIPILVEMLRRNNLRPHLLVHKQVLEEFKNITQMNPNCVVLGDAGANFTFQNMNAAFRVLINLAEPILFSLGIGKYYNEEDGLTLDVGAFTKALEYATGVTAKIVGKPQANFFHAAVKDMGVLPNEVVMIGDDLESDCGGAQNCGIRGVLVRTGKFRPSDENHPSVKPDAIVTNLYQAVELILNHNVL